MLELRIVGVSEAGCAALMRRWRSDRSDPSVVMLAELAACAEGRGFVATFRVLADDVSEARTALCQRAKRLLRTVGLTDSAVAVRLVAGERV